MVFETLSVVEAWSAIRPLLFFVLGMVIYALFIFKFYRFLAKKDLFSLNLNDKYNKAREGFFSRILKGIFYVIEYLLVFPLFTFFWFAVLTVLMSLLTREQTVNNILLVSIAVVGAVRVTAYYSEDLSRDLAKMLPFALLGVFLVDISYFSLNESFVILEQIPGHLTTLVYYLAFAILIEFIMRIFSLFRKKDPSSDE